MNIKMSIKWNIDICHVDCWEGWELGVGACVVQTSCRRIVRGWMDGWMDSQCEWQGRLAGMDESTWMNR